jgi:hypothetical protein
MRIHRLVPLLIAATVAMTSIAYAGTDLEVFQKRALKNSSDNNFEKIKNLCLCQSNNRVGVMEFFAHPTEGGYIGCYQGTFDSEGKLVAEVQCNPWVPLPK